MNEEASADEVVPQYTWLADALTIATSVLVTLGPKVAKVGEGRSVDSKSEPEQMAKTIDVTVRRIVPWCQWLRSPSCKLESGLRSDLSALADAVTVSLLALSAVLDGATDVALTSAEELERLSGDKTKDWLATHLSPAVLNRIEHLANSTAQDGS